MEYLIVEFEEQRNLVIDDALTAWRTNETVPIPAGYHVVALSLPTNFAPPHIEVMMAGTSVGTPKIIKFSKL